MKTDAKQWKVGTATCIFENESLTPADMDRIVEGGVAMAELDMQVRWLKWPIDDLKNAWRPIGNYAEKIGLQFWSLHLPFDWNNDPSRLLEHTRKAIVARHRALMAAAKETLHIEKAVIHPSYEPIPDENREEYIQQLRKSLIELRDAADELGVQLAVEDLPRTCLGNTTAEMLRIVDGIDRLRVCCDTNHLLMDKTEDFIRALGDRIVTVHLSDYDFVDERHWLPGKGLNDWNAIISALEDVGYQGPAMFEISRDYCPSDPRILRDCWEQLLKNRE